jgi:DNA-binding transcriptional ArsR family regulator
MCCVGDMVDCLGLPQAFVSRHLAILRDAGVVTSTVEGRNRIAQANMLHGRETRKARSDRSIGMARLAA